MTKQEKKNIETMYNNYVTRSEMGSSIKERELCKSIVKEVNSIMLALGYIPKENGYTGKIEFLRIK